MDCAQEKGELPPQYSAVAAPAAPVAPALAPHRVRPAWHRRGFRRSRGLRFIGLAILLFIGYAQWRQLPASSSSGEVTTYGLSVKRLQEDLATCAKLQSKPVDPAGLGREKNARYIDGHKPTLIKNATVWIGEPAEGTSAEDARAGKGWSWIKADVYLEHGLIKRVEKDISVKSVSKDALVYDANGRPLTTGIIDMHSHAGVFSLPSLWGNQDTNEMSSDITPYVRSIDAIQPGDHQIQVIKSGGVTTSLILPGSGNNMGGEAYVVKLAVGKEDGRNETSAADMLADPDRTWRYMKMACGENAKRVYGKVGEHGPISRMGESWEFRHAFEQASKLVGEQDDWCRAASTLGVDKVTTYLPQELRWESLGALLRGQVHLNTHCYTIPDLEAFVDHTNEFKFKVRAFHHAHQTYLVPGILKRAYGGDPPASAIFATTMWYKTESYIGSEYAGKKLWDEGLTPIYVSDNPVINAQHVVFEAAKGYRFGLPYHAAMQSVTTAPAERLGLGQRLGKVKPGFDADIVVWDSDPLSVGAAPVQVWIDGTAQYEDPVELKKPAPEPIVPDSSLGHIVEEPSTEKSAIYTGITKSFLSTGPQDLASEDKTYNLVILNGSIACIGTCESATQSATSQRIKTIPLNNGYLVPSFVAFGSTLGLNAIDAEKDTDNGASPTVFSRGLDGLALGTKKLRVAHRYGVTRAVSAPKFARGATHHGTSVGFLTGASTPLEQGAVFADDAAVHYTLDLSAKSGEAGTPSISAAVGALRRKLLDAVGSLDETIKDAYSEAAYLRKVVAGELPLAITVHSADTISAVLSVKRTVQAALARGNHRSPTLRFLVVGGAESHLVAGELAAAGVGVVLAPLLSYRMTWDQRRALTGAPLTNGTAVDVLVAAGVKVAIGVEEDWRVYDLGLLAGIAYKNGGGRIGEREALGLVGRNLFEMLGLKEGEEGEREHFVVYEGSPFEIGSRVRAVGGGNGVVSVF